MTDHENNRTVPNALPIGYRFNEFEIKQVIGGGGFGIVYRAWDHQLERTIAIKEFMPSSLATRHDDMRLVLRSERFGKAFSAGLNSFIQEARLLARFNHPNLLHVLRFWVQNDTAYMGTLFYSGTTLSRLRQQQPELINEAWIRRMLPMLFGAIKTIHDEGYLHRDISLDNIQIQDNGLPVLLDFGSARRTIGNLSDETETMLRPGFAPIEQYTDDNESEQGPWTDIYAVGAVLHTLIVGTPPPVSVVRSIQDSYLPLAERQPAGYSLPLLQAIDRALALYMEDRPQSIDEFAALIDMPVAGIDDVLSVKQPGTMLVPVAEEEAPAPAAHNWQRYKVPGMVAAGVIAGLIVGGMLFSGTRDVPPPVATPPVATPPVTTPPVTTPPVTTPPVTTPPVTTPPVTTPPATTPPATTPPATTPPVTTPPATTPPATTPPVTTPPVTTPPATTPPVTTPSVTTPPVTTPPVTTPPTTAPVVVAAEPIARVYVRIREGEQLKLNGEKKTLTPAANGFATLALAPGHYELILQGNGQSRRQLLEINQPGTWLISPQP